MTNRGNLSLPELAARYKISDIYGGSVAYFSSQEGGLRDLRAVTNRISVMNCIWFVKGVQM